MSDHAFIATRKGLFRLDRRGNGWKVGQTSFAGDLCSMVMHDPRDGAVYASLGHGHFGVKMHRSADMGETWEEIATPIYPEKPDDYEPRIPPIGGKPAPWSLELVWELQPGGADQPGRIWCGTLPGGLFKSDDRGATWELNRPLWDDERREEWFGGGYDVAGIHSVLVDPRDSQNITLGVSCGGVWRSEDDGASWNLTAKGLRAEYMPPERAYDENIQDAHIVVRCPSQPDCMWVQHHNGIFRTTDNAKQWVEFNDVKPSTFGFTVAVHPNDPDTAWFVPAIKDEKRIPVDGKFVVTRTRNGGGSFETLANGLPQENAYDLVFRHALDVDQSGARLLMGTTTGNVFASDNGGDSWQQVTAHLPPVYTVRFVKQ